MFRPRARAAGPGSASRDVAPADVLLVEDDELERGVLCAVLERAGLCVRAAADAARAAELVGERVPHVVITDLDLREGHGGVELAQRLRSAAASAEVRLVAISGAVEPDWPVARHFDAYLRKPLDLELLLDLVERLAAQVRPGAATGAPRRASERR